MAHLRHAEHTYLTANPSAVSPSKRSQSWSNTMGSLLSISQPEPEWKSEARFAMESSCFCVVCGSPFGLHGEIYNFDTEAVHYQVHTAL
jgi:hypothetical protein